MTLPQAAPAKAKKPSFAPGSFGTISEGGLPFLTLDKIRQASTLTGQAKPALPSKLQTLTKPIDDDDDFDFDDSADVVFDAGSAKTSSIGIKTESKASKAADDVSSTSVATNEQTSASFVTALTHVSSVEPDEPEEDWDLEYV